MPVISLSFYGSYLALRLAGSDGRGLTYLLIAGLLAPFLRVLSDTPVSSSLTFTAVIVQRRRMIFWLFLTGSFRTLAGGAWRRIASQRLYIYGIKKKTAHFYTKFRISQSCGLLAIKGVYIHFIITKHECKSKDLVNKKIQNVHFFTKL